MIKSNNSSPSSRGVQKASPRGGLVGVVLLLFLLCACSQVIQQRSADETKKAMADSLIEHSYALFDSCQFQEAILVGQEALKAYQAIDDSASQSDCYSHMTFCHQRLGDVESGIEQTLKGLHLDSLRNDRARMGSDYNNLAALYITAQNPKQALPFILKAIEMEESLEVPEKLSIRYGMACEIYTKLDSTAKALQYIQRAYALDSAAKDTVKMARRLSQQGDALTAAKQYEKAESSYKQANLLLEAKHSLASLCINHKQLGNLYLKMNRTADARSHLAKSADMARHMNNRYVLQQTLKTLSSIESNDHQALAYLRESYDLSDSVYSEKTSQMMGSQAARFETLQKEQTIREQQYKLERQTIWMLLGLLLATFFLILAIILIYILRARSKSYQSSVHLLRKQYDESISQLLHKNMDAASEEVTEGHVMDDETDILLTRLNQIILSKLSDTSLNSEMLAEEMYMSKRNLNRRVKEITNIDTASYIREFRIQAARRMLSETSLPIAEICMNCGFDSPSYFSRAFKSATDMSPSAYRKTVKME